MMVVFVNKNILMNKRSRFFISGNPEVICGFCTSNSFQKDVIACWMLF